MVAKCLVSETPLLASDKRSGGGGDGRREGEEGTDLPSFFSESLLVELLDGNYVLSPLREAGRERKERTSGEREEGGERSAPSPSTLSSKISPSFKEKEGERETYDSHNCLVVDVLFLCWFRGRVRVRSGRRRS